MTSVNYGADIFDATIRGLEAGLRVSQIATFELATCPLDVDVATVLADSSLEDFDAIPVADAGRIVGVLEREHADQDVSVGSAMLPLSQVRLTSAHAPLLSYLLTRGDEPYTLVVDEHGPRGIVTRSDFLKLPVRLLAFAFVTHLELVMRETIAVSCGHDDERWRGFLSKGRSKRLDENVTKLKTYKMDPAPLELTELCDKREILHKLFHLGSEFNDDLKEVEKLRNPLAHAGNYAAADDELAHFIQRLRIAARWIKRIPELAP